MRGVETGSLPDDRRGGVRKKAAVFLLVVAASAVVALGGNGTGVLLPAANLEEGWARVVRMGGAAAAIAGLVALLAQRTRLRSGRRHGPDPSGVGLRAAGTIMGVLAVLALLGPSVSVEDDADTVPAGGTAINPEAPGLPPPPSTSAPLTEGFTTEEARDYRLGPVVRPSQARARDGRSAADPGWSIPPRLASILLLILLLAGAAVAARAWTGRPRLEEHGPPPETLVAAADAEAGLLASLEDVAEEGGDPRRQVTAAYHRLLAALGAAGAPRQPPEAPHEHLHRALGPLGVRPEPMHRLTELYVRAQFSERGITERHRAAAVEALQASLDGLRAAAEEMEP